MKWAWREFCFGANSLGNRMKRKRIFWSHYMNFSSKGSIFGLPREEKAQWVEMWELRTNFSSSNPNFASSSLAVT